jgi:hypothetical protein
MRTPPLPLNWPFQIILPANTEVIRSAGAGIGVGEAVEVLRLRNI